MTILDDANKAEQSDGFFARNIRRAFELLLGDKTKDLSFNEEDKSNSQVQRDNKSQQ